MFYKEDRTTGAIMPTEILRDQVSNFLPVTFEEQTLRVYSRRREVEHIAHAAFKLWCNLEGFQESTFFSPSRKRAVSIASPTDGLFVGGERLNESVMSSQRAREELASQIVL